MKKQKFNSITFHEAAKAIVEKYFGEVPFFTLKTESSMKSNAGQTKQQFMITYRPENEENDVQFWIFEKTPVECLAKLESKFMCLLNIVIPEKIDEIKPFDLPY